MTALAKLRTERGRMSAMDRRIADYILANAQLLRDYSSQQLADVLKVSQSSVVKFAQRLGYKGYPDLKLSVTEAIARASAAEQTPAAAGDEDAARADALWRAKAAAARETRGLAAPRALADVAAWIAEAGLLTVVGRGINADAARGFAGRLTLLGRRAIALDQPSALLASLSAAKAGDLLLVLCGHGDGDEWQQACREMRQAGGRAVVVTRRTGRLAESADAFLVVSAHDPQPHVEDLVYEAALRQLLDDVFLRVIAANPGVLTAFAANRKRATAT
ncbi:MAG: MurR/RpiR family transcriptional regulator [Planctomycetaceae bacterium]